MGGHKSLWPASQKFLMRIPPAARGSQKSSVPSRSRVILLLRKLRGLNKLGQPGSSGVALPKGPCSLAHHAFSCLAQKSLFPTTGFLLPNQFLVVFGSVELAENWFWVAQETQIRSQQAVPVLGARGRHGGAGAAAAQVPALDARTAPLGAVPAWPPRAGRVRTPSPAPAPAPPRGWGLQGGSRWAPAAWPSLPHPTPPAQGRDRDLAPSWAAAPAAPRRAVSGCRGNQTRLCTGGRARGEKSCTCGGGAP